MQAIRVKYFGPGNVRGSRLKATASAGSITIEYDDALNIARNAAQAALALCAKMGWEGDLIEGGLPDGSFVFCFANADRHANPYRRPVTS